MKHVFSRRVCLPLCLVLGLALAGGCSYSASSTTETSVGVDVNGKPQASASASMNVERSTDGKTVNHNTSVKLDSQTGAGVSNQRVEASAEDGTKFIVEDIILRKGETEISGYFTKENGPDSVLKSLVLSFEITSGKKTIWADEGNFDNVNISVRSGARTPHTFVITNPEAPAYDGPFDFHYNIRY